MAADTVSSTVATPSARDSRSVTPASASIRRSAAQGQARLQGLPHLLLGQVRTAARASTPLRSDSYPISGGSARTACPNSCRARSIETSLVSDQQQRFGAISGSSSCSATLSARLAAAPRPRRAARRPTTQQRPCPRRRILQRFGDLSGRRQQRTAEGTGQRGQDPRPGVLIIDERRPHREARRWKRPGDKRPGAAPISAAYQAADRRRTPRSWRTALVRCRVQECRTPAGSPPARQQARPLSAAGRARPACRT